MESLGGVFSNSVTSKTTYLVVGEEPGRTKLSRAKQLGIPTISEEEFLNMIKDYVNIEELKRERREGYLF